MTKKTEMQTDLRPDMPYITAAIPTDPRKKTTGLGIRSKRIQLLLQPSLYTQVKELAQAKGYSVNDLIHRLLEEAVEEDERSIHDERI